MAIRHLKDGENFGPEHFDRAFGFSGSAEGVSPKPSAAQMEGGRHSGHLSEKNGGEPSTYAGGGMADHHPHGHHVVRSEGHDDGTTHHHHAHGGITVEHGDGHMSHHHHDGSPVKMAEGGMHEMHHLHPHGHDVAHVEHHADGRIVHHHSHGGHTVHHKDGRVTHHMEDGSPVAMMPHSGIETMHDSSEFAHGGQHRGDMAGEKAMIRKGVRQHEDHEHGGEHTDLALAGGGRTRLPRGMRPMAARIKTPTEHMPSQRSMPSMRNEQPAGSGMGYGVEPSAEPDDAGSDQGVPTMRRGGAKK